MLVTPDKPVYIFWSQLSHYIESSLDGFRTTGTETRQNGSANPTKHLLTSDLPLAIYTCADKLRLASRVDPRISGSPSIGQSEIKNVLSGTAGYDLVSMGNQSDKLRSLFSLSGMILEIIPNNQKNSEYWPKSSYHQNKSNYLTILW